MDLFDLAAKITLDSSEYERGAASAQGITENLEQSMLSLKASYNIAKANVKELSSALQEYVLENGDASGGAQELAYMLAEQQTAAEEAKESMRELADSEKEAGDEADDASGKTGSFADKLKSGLATAAKVGAAAITAVVTATAAMSAAIAKGVSETAEYGDNIDKMSQKMGISAQAYQEWDAVMRHSGTSMETLKAGMKTLANAVENGNEAFQRIGLTQEQIASMSNEDLFAATIAGLQNVENETERTYLAGQLLGRGATELGALLNTSAEDTEAMRQKVHELGGVMSDEAVKASAAYQDSLRDMQTAFGGLSRNIISDFLPSLSMVMDGIGNLVSGNGGIEQISEGINQFAEKLSQGTPKFVETAGQLMSAFGSAIISNLPILIDSGTQLVVMLAQGLIENLPTIATAAVQIILTIATGISSNIPSLIPAIVQVVLQIVQTLISNAPQLVNAALQIITALAQGIIQAMPEVIRTVPQIIASLISALIAMSPEILAAGIQLIVSLGMGLIEAIPELLINVPQIILAIVGGLVQGINQIREVGAQIVRGLWEGIKGAWGSLVSSVTSLFSGLVGRIKGLFGIHSPSKVMRDEVGKFIALGIAEGIEDKRSDAEKNAEKLAQSVYNKLKSWADKTVKYNKLSLAEQISLWEAIQSQYQKGSEQYADAEDKLFDLREKRLKELEDAEKEYVDKVKEIYKTIDDLEENYQKQLKDRAQEIYNSYKLFDEIPEREEVSGQQLIDNLRGQIDSIQEFYSGIEELERRGGVALAEEVRQMGVGSIDQLTALLNLSDDKLSEYASLFEEKQKLANDLATGQLKELRAETDKEIQANMDSLADIIGQAVNDSGDWGHDLMWNFIVGMQSMEGSLQSTADRVAETINGMWSGSSGGKFTADSVVARKLDKEYSNKTQNISINIDGTGANAEQIGRELYKMMKRKGVAL